MCATRKLFSEGVLEDDTGDVDEVEARMASQAFRSEYYFLQIASPAFFCCGDSIFAERGSKILPKRVGLRTVNEHVFEKYKKKGLQPV